MELRSINLGKLRFVTWTYDTFLHERKQMFICYSGFQSLEACLSTNVWPPQSNRQPSLTNRPCLQDFTELLFIQMIETSMYAGPHSVDLLILRFQFWSRRRLTIVSGICRGNLEDLIFSKIYFRWLPSYSSLLSPLWLAKNKKWHRSTLIIWNDWKGFPN